jgi:hypothetical protein
MKSDPGFSVDSVISKSLQNYLVGKLISEICRSLRSANTRDPEALCKDQRYDPARASQAEFYRSSQHNVRDEAFFFRNVRLVCP